MADSKITALTALTSLTSDDLICVVDSPGSSPVTKKITAANFSSSLASLLGLSIGSGKTLTASNTLTLVGTDGSTLNVGAGGTLGSNAFTSTAFTNGSGTANTLPKFTAGTTLGNSRILDNGTAVDVQSGTFKVSGVGGTEVSLLASEGDIYLGSQTQKFLHVNEFLVRYADAPPGTVDYFTVDTTNNNAQIILQSQGITGKRLSLAAASRTYAIGDVDGVNGGTQVAIDDGDQTVTIAATSGLSLPTITTGLWHGTVIGAAYGGFGVDISASSGVPLFATGTPTFTGTSGSGNFVRVTTPTIATPSFTTGFTIGGVAASGTIPRGNGTNFVASAFTVAVPGTSGNVLTSDGTNWTSAAPVSGTTINSTNSVIPQRSNSTTFIDSPITGSVPGSMADGFTVTGAATANPAIPRITATGSDTNIGISFGVKGTAPILFGATSPVGSAFVEIKNTATAWYPLRVLRSSANQTLYGVFEESDGAASLYMTNGSGTTTILLAAGTSLDSYINNGKFGIGTTTVSAKLHSLSTTEQLRLGYDASNYFSTTVGSTGGVTFDAVGSGSAFIFSDGVTLATAKVFSIASGTNQRAGNATLIGGTVTVSNTTVTANTVVILTRKTSGGTIGTAITYTVSAGTSFTIASDNILDTSVFSYFLIEVP